jgi:hypothetical protein
MKQLLGTVLALATALGGCAHYKVPCPVAGGPTWIEVRSPHFIVRTDLPRAQAEAMVREDEAMLARFETVAGFLLPGEAETPLTSIIAFRDQWQFNEWVGTNEIGSRTGELGYFDPIGDERGRPLVVMHAEALGATVFRHEITHRLLEQHLGEPPHWLGEGLAEYFSQLPVTDGKVRLGALTARFQGWNASRSGNNHERLDWLMMPPVTALLQLEKGMPWVAYLPASVLVHWMANGGPDHADRFRRFLAAVAQGVPARAALMKEYGPLDQINRAYRAHFQPMKEGKALQWFIAYTPPPALTAQLAWRDLDDGEVHAIKARLRASASERELALAAKHDPASPALHDWQARRAEQRGDWATAVHESEQAATDATVDEPHYRLERFRRHWQAQLQRPEAERQPTLLADEARAVAKVARWSAELDLVADYFLAAGELDLGTTFSARALASEPYCAPCLVTMARAYYLHGELRQATDTLAAALQHWPPWETKPKALEARLETYRRSAAAAQNGELSKK